MTERHGAGAGPLVSAPMSSFFSEDVGEPGTAWQPPPAASRWRLVGELGAGGMGRVHLAWDSWLEREVAIKEPRTPEAIAALSREVRVTAGLEHPGIVAVHDIVAAPNGQPWFVMPVVRGRSMARELDGGDGTGPRLDLVRALLAVCDTLAFAHDKGVIHGDLKPANILLDHFGQTRVIDWGLASKLDVGERAPSRRGGTARWMSPEQARGEPPRPADDVFSLGAILQTLLSGPEARAHIADSDDAARQALPGAAHLQATAPDAPPDLVAIMARALAPSLATRYADAAAMADDLRRYLDGRLVSAHRYSLRERVSRFVRRYRAPLAVAAVAAVALGVSAVVSALRIDAAEAEAERSLGRALVLGGDAALRRANGVEARAMAEQALALGGDAEISARGLALAAAPTGLNAASPAVGPACPDGAAMADDGTVTLCGTADMTRVSASRGGQPAWERALDHRRGLVALAPGTFAAAAVDSVTVVDATHGRTLRHDHTPCSYRLAPTARGRAAYMQRPHCVLLVTPTSNLVVPLDACPLGRVTAFAAAVDLDTVALACETGELAIGSVTRGGFRTLDTRLSPPGLGVASLAFSADGARLIVGTQQGWLLTVSTHTGARIQKLALGGYIDAIAASPDGARAIVHQHVDAPLLIDLDALAPIERLPRPTRHAAWSPDGAFFTLADGTASRQRWDPAAARPRELAVSHGVTGLGVSQDGALLAVAQDQWVTIVDMTTRRPVARHRWQRDVVKSVQFLEGGELLTHGLGDGGSVLIERPREERDEAPRTQLSHPIARRVLRLRSGDLITSTWAQGTMRVDGKTGATVVLGPLVTDLLLAPDGERMVGLDEDGRVWQARSPRNAGDVKPCGVVEGGRGLALGDGGEVLVLTANGIASACGGDERYALTATGEDIPAPLTAVAATGELRVAGGRDGTVWFWRRGNARPLAAWRGHEGRVAAIAVDPGGAWIATGGWDTRVRFWETRLLSAR